MALQQFELSPAELRWNCEPELFHFRSTADIAPLKGIVEQDRPTRAIHFGLGIASPGYNIYVSGLTGTGKTTVIKQFLDEIAADRPTPEDWCYVYNFRDANAPTVLSLPAGKGKTLRREMQELVRHLEIEIPKAFESKEYERSMDALVAETQLAQQAAFNALAEKARAQGFTIEVTKLGVTLIPLLDGKPATPEAYDQLDTAIKQQFETRRGELQDDINAFLRKMRDTNKASRDKAAELQRGVGLYVVNGKVDSIREQFADFPQVSAYLDEVQDHILSHLEDFTEDGVKGEGAAGASTPVRTEPPSDPFLKYQVNVFVDNTGVRGAPIVIETNPTYYNMFGRIERRAHLGALLTDFTMVRPGAFVRANGGFLVVNAHDVLLNPGVWESLKRAVKNCEARVEDMGEQYGAVPVAGMRPSPIPTDVKVVMIGNQYIYHLLYGADEDFRKIFKVKADFDSQMNRDAKGIQDYVAFISTRCREEGLPHFDGSGVSEVLEYSARLVEDQRRLSARLSDVADIVREASYWARQDDKEEVSASHVRRAVEEKWYRSNLVEQRLRELIEEGAILVDVAGEQVGQVNGLAVIDLGDIRFGKPSRVTAKTFLGKPGVVDIERESKMSGRIYEKGVLILSGYLGGRYAQEHPLALAASICFEQSYDGIDGDSASSTELYALLSSLSQLPVDQGIAVTGSVNQHGEIQPIGGVNQKIEGFFDVCRAKGLSGRQGVIIPRQNVRNLMLRQDVVDAVAGGCFHIYAIDSVDEGIQILTGVPAGDRSDGGYPEGTVNFLVEKRLKELADRLRRLRKDRGADALDGEGEGI
jgi:lon-related putative ATP-dependent protease